MEIKPEVETFANIKVIGVGGSGGSAVNRMIDSKINGVEFASVNTDVQALHYSQANKKLHIGKSVTRGLGAGMDPEVGAKAAEESHNEIRDLLKGADMVFITCGLGGGTGSGAAPVIADIARELGALTVAVVTKPFSFEGVQRKQIADQAWENLGEKVDTIITIQNDRLLQIIDKKTSLIEAFKIVDDVLRHAVQGISELVTIPGLINVDFADVKSVMQEQGTALMGMGEASGENRAVEAAQMAISSPLLEVSMDGAKGVLFIITGSPDLTMHEVNEAAKIITDSAENDAKIIFGAILDDTLENELRITVIATGFEGKVFKQQEANTDSRVVSVAKDQKSTYKPSQFLVEENNKNEEPAGYEKSEQDDQPAKEKRVIDDYKVPAARKSDQSDQEKKSAEDGDDEEDLDIPAFIRKKMM